MEFEFVKVEVLLPEEYIVELRIQLNDIGVLTVGDYDNVVSYSVVKGYWRPLEEANPFNGSPFNGSKDEISFGTECKMEFKCLMSNIAEVKGLIKRVHPYEEPVINVLPMLS
ncbi:cytochrome c biogenesis protein [Oceanobacillus manasiensis]|uniref:cytochrome c biogenesis protein n=1 Tax=Oceanobacillus manasiensis TaxID=586413 RepID=UPI0005A8B0E3|nr:cytochrome c biogenesis protein [Oceanobacillus manasiensis]